MDGSSGISCENLGVAVAGRQLVNELTFELGSGSFLAVLGQNGCGKSLTMHTLAGLRPADTGIVGVFGRTHEEYSRQELARTLALLPQHTEDVFPATVMETVMIGRHPHISRFQWESRSDLEIARQALVRMDLAEMAHRDVTTLSGGERRRLAIAQTLTQTPKIYLLDEPTNHLDPQHQLDVLETFRCIASQGDTVIASLHDVNLAARYADQCLLLFGDGRWEFGSTDAVLDEKRLSELYSTPMEPVAWRDFQLYIANRRA